MLNYINLASLIYKILNIKSWSLCAPEYLFRVTWCQLVVLCVALQRSMAAMIEASISGSSQVVIAAIVYLYSAACCAASPTPLSSGAVIFVSCIRKLSHTRICYGLESSQTVLRGLYERIEMVRSPFRVDVKSPVSYHSVFYSKTVQLMHRLTYCSTNSRIFGK